METVDDVYDFQKNSSKTIEIEYSPSIQCALSKCRLENEMVQQNRCLFDVSQCCRRMA